MIRKQFKMINNDVYNEDYSSQVDKCIEANIFNSRGQNLQLLYKQNKFDGIPFHSM